MHRVQGTDLDVLESALRHWREKVSARNPDDHIINTLLLYRHKSVVAAAAMGVPDLCEIYAVAPHERKFT